MLTRKVLSKEEYGSYYQNYIDKSSDLSLLEGLRSNLKEIISFYESIPNDKLEYRYAEAKWTIKEIIQHLMDTERIFAYRALRVARRDETNLPGFEQDDYVLTSNANHRSLHQLIQEYKVLRTSTIHLMESLSQHDLAKIGKASDAPISARAAGFIIIGHENHHREVIEQRYL